MNRSVGPNATDAQKEAKMKENLYSDLTGLIIRGVKRKEGEDEYDCIQTGRNGSKFPLRTPSITPSPLLTIVTSSPPLPSLHRQRQHHREPKDALRPLLRGSRVRVRAAAGREPRPRPHRFAARVPRRGDLLPAEPGGEILYEGLG